MLEFNRLENVKNYIGIYDRGGSTLLRTYLEKELAKEEAGLTPFAGKLPITLDGEFIIDLANVNNCFLIGGAGRGKTAMVYSILTQLILLNDSNDLDILIVDAKDFGRTLTTMKAFEKAENVNRLIFDEYNLEDCYTNIYEELRKELKLRYEMLAIGLKLVDKVLIFDDLLFMLRVIQTMDTDSYINFMDLVYMLASEAESLNLHILMLAQHPQEISIEIIKNCDLTILLSVPRISDYVVLGYPEGTNVEYQNVLYKHASWESTKFGNQMYVASHPNSLLRTTLELCDPDYKIE